MKHFYVTDEHSIRHLIEASDMLAALTVYVKVLAPQLNSGEPVRIELWQ